jgi:hypothetical protein
MPVILLMPSGLMFSFIFIYILLVIFFGNFNFKYSVDYIVIILIGVNSLQNCRKHPHAIMLIIEYLLYVAFTGVFMYAYAPGYDLQDIIGNNASKVVEDIGKRSNYALKNPSIIISEVINNENSLIFSTLLFVLYLIRIIKLKINKSPHE